ncbi:hypothetical protein [Fibrobacter sp.]|uniref:hypothetical protein n=1 Tax=Fibrobacter sp. TaxID=35828 RepID=UPI00388E936A
MTQDVFYIEIAKARDTLVYKFTRSATGMFDYEGDVTADFFSDGNPKDAGRSYSDSKTMQRVDSSLYFSPSWYTYLHRDFAAEISVYIPQNIKDLDANQYSFLVHIGAILLAIHERDTLLVAELLHRRASVFAEFMPLMMHILKPVAAEALFAWVYGSFNGVGKFLQVYASETPIKSGETDTAAILFAAAKDSLKPEPAKESPEQMFVRFFKQEIPFDFTIGLVGANNHPWVDSLDELERICSRASAHDFSFDRSNVGFKRQDLFENLKTNVQVESYNPHDPNAIGVSIDNPISMLKGFPGKSKAGYIRATGAAILRKARPDKFGYEASLRRVGGNPSWVENAIIVQIKM